MHDSFVVRELQRLANLRDDLQRLAGREFAGLFQLPQVGSIHIFHDEVVKAVHLAEFVERHDVRVAQFSEGTGLAREALGESRVASRLQREDLERDQPVNLVLAGLIDRSHAAGPKQLDNLKLWKMRGDLGDRGRRPKFDAFLQPALRVDAAAQAHLQHALRTQTANGFGANRLAAMLAYSLSVHNCLHPLPRDSVEKVTEAEALFSGPARETGGTTLPP